MRILSISKRERHPMRRLNPLRRRQVAFVVIHRLLQFLSFFNSYRVEGPNLSGQYKP